MDRFSMLSTAFCAFLLLGGASSPLGATVLKAQDYHRLPDGRVSVDAPGDSESRITRMIAEAGRQATAGEAARADDADAAFLDPNGGSRPVREPRQGNSNGWAMGETVPRAGTAEALPGGGGDWFEASVFDGVTGGGGWVLSATAEYYDKATEAIGFDPRKILSRADRWAASAGGLADVKPGQDRAEADGGSGGGLGLYLPGLLFLLGLAIVLVRVVARRRPRSTAATVTREAGFS